MATYVFSDVHGHHRPLERLLERVSPADDDEVWVIGDMVDRGPDPISVIRTCQALPGVRVLMGNHEAMMLDYVHAPYDPTAAFQWEMNGGYVTNRGLGQLSDSERVDLINWMEELPLGAHVKIEDRLYILVHAGLRPLGFSSHSRWTDTTIDTLLRYQNRDDLLWIREEFWGRPTGFLNEKGEGPIVIAGHTPVPYVEESADTFDHPARDADGQCHVMHLGGSELTGGVSDRWAIDCGAAGGAGWGRIGIVRLDDGAEFYEAIEEGE